MNKLFGIMCVIVLFTGCGYREKQFNEESGKIQLQMLAKRLMVN